MNELIYNVYSDKDDKYDLSENEIEFMVPLKIYKNLHTELPIAEKNRCLFFNLLFNKIGYDRVIPFLNFYFDNYLKDKKEFLRVLKLDIDEIFERFEIPWREEKLILRNPSGSAFWDTSKLVISEIMPFFDPYDYNTYVNYKRRYKEANYWIENKSESMSTVPSQEILRVVKLLNIPTRATPEQIHDFWLKLHHNNEKGEPYWDSEKEIEHFIYQNFDVFPGVDEIKVFNPNMSKSELNHVTWIFYHHYGMSNTKKQYEKLLMQNFIKFKDGTYVYSNIKDQNNEHLKQLFK